MSLDQLLPKAAENKQDKHFDSILYFFLHDCGWSYDTFINTPIPVIMRMLRQHEAEIKKKAKAEKKKGKK